jgi:rhodanese-related sulfurtransferase
MARFVTRAVLCAFLLIGALPAWSADTPTDKAKLTVNGKYLTAVEAYAMVKAAPDKTAVIDVRTPEEYDFLGHADMAANIPFMFWTGKFNAEKKVFALAENADFVAAVKKNHQPGDVLLIMCRSGQRSAPAVNKLVEAGFANTYTVVDGFEGDKVADKDSPDFGKRKQNGWANSKLPWTYALDEKLIFEAGK